MHSNHLWNTWSNLIQVVKTGNSAHSTEINELGEEWLFTFINAMHVRAKKQAPQQIANIDLSGIKSVLDIGGGSGAYSIPLIQFGQFKSNAYFVPENNCKLKLQQVVFI